MKQNQLFAPIEAATLLVAIAVTGGMPVKSSAGKDIKPPPPTTVSIKAAMKPVAIKNKKQIKINIVHNMFLSKVWEYKLHY